MDRNDRRALKLNVTPRQAKVTTAKGRERIYEYDSTQGTLAQRTIYAYIQGRSPGYCLLINDAKDDSVSTLFVIGCCGSTRFVMQYTVERLLDDTFMLITPGALSSTPFASIDYVVAHCINEVQFATTTVVFKFGEYGQEGFYRYARVQQTNPSVVRAYVMACKRLGYCVLADTGNPDSNTVFVCGGTFVTQHTVFRSADDATCVLVENKSKQTTFSSIESAIVYCINKVTDLSNTKNAYSMIKAVDYMSTPAVEERITVLQRNGPHGRFQHESTRYEDNTDDAGGRFDRLQTSSTDHPRGRLDKRVRRGATAAAVRYDDDDDDMIGRLVGLRVSSDSADEQTPPVAARRPRHLAVQETVCYSAIRGRRWPGIDNPRKSTPFTNDYVDATTNNTTRSYNSEPVYTELSFTGSQDQ